MTNALDMYRSPAAARRAGIDPDVAEMVRRIACRIGRRLPPHEPREDVMQSGLLGALEAARSHDPALGSGLATHCGRRARGEIIDELRRGDWTPRSVRADVRRVRKAYAETRRARMRSPRAREVAAHLDITLDKYHDIRAREDRALIRWIGDVRTPTAPSAAEDVEHEALYAALAAAVDNLPERERLAVSLYYEDGLTLRAIGERIGMGESGACRVCARGIARLRVELSGWLE